MRTRRSHVGLTASRPSGCFFHVSQALTLSSVGGAAINCGRDDFALSRSVPADEARGFQFGCRPAVYTARSQHPGLRPMVLAPGHFHVGEPMRRSATRQPRPGVLPILIGARNEPFGTGCAGLSKASSVSGDTEDSDGAHGHQY